MWNILLIIACLLIISSCEEPTSSDNEIETFLIKLDNYRLPDEALDQEPFKITRVYAIIGENSCYSFYAFDTIKTHNKIDIWFRGIYDTTYGCEPVDVILNYEDFTINPPFSDPFVVNIHQPGDTVLVDTIKIKYMSQDPQWINYTKNSSSIPSNEICAITIDIDNNVWVGTEDYNTGIFMFDGDKIEDFSEYRYDFHHYYVEAMTTDNYGNIWVGSYMTACFSKYDGSSWSLYELPGDIYYDDVHSIVADKNNTIWVGTHHNHLYRFDGTAVIEMDTINTLKNRYVEALGVDSHNNILAGLFNGIVCKYDHNNWTIYDLMEMGFIDSYFSEVQDLSIDSNDNIYVTTYGEGLIQFSDGAWLKYCQDNSGIPTDYLNKLAIDSEDNVWITSGVGLIKYDGINWTLYNNENSGVLDYSGMTIAIDSKDHVWLGSRNFGLTLYKNGND